MSTPYARLPRWVDYGLIPLINLLVAFIVAGLVVMLVGENPFHAAVILVDGAFGSGQGIAYTLYYTTNFIFTGLAVAVAFHAGLFNIGGEGQAYVGGLGVILIALALNGLHWTVMFPLMIVCGALFAGLMRLSSGPKPGRRFLLVGAFAGAILFTLGRQLMAGVETKEAAE